MRIKIDGLGKRFNRRWVFRGLSTDIAPGSRVGIRGHNGAGKSTLIKILSNAMPASEGEVHYFEADRSEIKDGVVFRQISFAAPYTDLIEELSIAEMLTFHVKFRSLWPEWNVTRILDTLGGQFRPETLIRSLSSGMKQRVRLVLAMATECSCLILDEPTTNLDVDGKHWFEQLLEHVPGDVTVLIASNETSDMTDCQYFLDLEDYSDLK